MNCQEMLSLFPKPQSFFMRMDWTADEADCSMIWNLYGTRERFENLQSREIYAIVAQSILRGRRLLHKFISASCTCCSPAPNIRDPSLETFFHNLQDVKLRILTYVQHVES